MNRPMSYLLACLVLATAGLTGCSGPDGPRRSLETFLRGWPTGALHGVGFLTPEGTTVLATEVATQLKALSGELADTPPALAADGAAQLAGDIATARVTVDWPLGHGVRWRYPTTVRLRQAADDAWQVIWEPAVVHPRLTREDALAVRRLPAPRGAILDGAGAPLVAPRPVVHIGVEPQRVVDLPRLVRDLTAAFATIEADTGRIDLADLPARVGAARPDSFLPIVTLRRETYQKIRSRIQPLDGTVFRADTRQLAPTRTFARGLLGTVDEVTKEDLDANPDAFVAGDFAGHGGLQGRYDQRLRGTPGQAVVIARTAADGAVTDTELFRADATTGAAVKTTLDVRVQNAAELALRGERRTSALVALRVADSAVLAAANGPAGAGNLAFTGQVPPGSAFKVVTALGLLDAGQVTLDGRVNCPKNHTVDGQTFRNSTNFELGNVPFRLDFAKSCNTAFAQLAGGLGAQRLIAAGAALGLGRPWDLGIEAAGGQVSGAGTPAELAMAAFGQGATQVSPLALAGVAAAVARGQWKQPTVLLDPVPANPAPDGPPLKASSAGPLRTMMREVVTVGTATALRDVPGAAVSGKTGTAQFDTARPERTHAWFIGWRGDVAFAVFVENGGDSGTSAVPAAERFLRAL